MQFVRRSTDDSGGPLIGALNLPIQLDDSAIRDELANLRLQASTLVTAVNAAAQTLAGLSVGFADLKVGLAQTNTSVAGLAQAVSQGQDAITHHLADIEADLAVLRDLIPERKPTFLVNFSIRNKEHT